MCAILRRTQPPLSLTLRRCKFRPGTDSQAIVTGIAESPSLHKLTLDLCEWTEDGIYQELFTGIKAARRLTSFSFSPRKFPVRLDIPVAVAFYDLLSEKRSLDTLELIQPFEAWESRILGPGPDLLAYAVAKNLAHNTSLRKLTMSCHRWDDTYGYEELEAAIRRHEDRKHRRQESERTRRPYTHSAEAGRTVASELGKSLNTNSDLVSLDFDRSDIAGSAFEVFATHGSESCSLKTIKINRLRIPITWRFRYEKEVAWTLSTALMLAVRCPSLTHISRKDYNAETDPDPSEPAAQADHAAWQLQMVAEERRIDTVLRFNRYGRANLLEAINQNDQFRAMEVLAEFSTETSCLLDAMKMNPTLFAEWSG